MNRTDKWALIVAVNDDRVLKNTLLRSPDIDSRCQIILKRGFKSASEAYNAAISEASGRVLVFAHQDVYLPSGWLDKLLVTLRRLEVLDPAWGVLGVYGVANSGQGAGHVYATGLDRMLGDQFEGVIETTSLDEMLLITRGGSGVFFDEHLPGFHLYGTDVCLEARAKGLKSYIISALCIHNSNGKRVLPLAFWKSYLYMRKKWWKQLPIETCCAAISKPCLWPMLQSLKSSYNRLFNPSLDPIGHRTTDVEALWKDLYSRNSAQITSVTYTTRNVESPCPRAVRHQHTSSP